MNSKEGQDPMVEGPTEQLHVVRGWWKTSVKRPQRRWAGGFGTWGRGVTWRLGGRHGKLFRNGSYTQLWQLLGDLTRGKTEPAWEELSVLGETGETSPPSHMHAHVYTRMLIQVLMTHKDSCLFFFNCFFFLLESKGTPVKKKKKKSHNIAIYR